MKLQTFLLIAACGLQAACGGGSGSSGSGNNTGGDTVLSSTSGKAADGYLQNARVCLDINSNSVCDSGEPQTTTGAGGAYTLNATAEQIATYTILVEAIANQTIDEDDPDNAITAGYTLRAPAGSTFVSPLTTLIQNALDNNPLLTTAQASAQIASSMGVDPGTDLMADFIAADDSTLRRASQNLASVLAAAISQARTDAGSSLTDSNFGAVLAEILDQMTELADNIAQQQNNANLPVIDVLDDETSIDDLVAEEEAESSATAVSVTTLLDAGIYDYEFDANLDDNEGYLIRFALERNAAGKFFETRYQLAGNNWSEDNDSDIAVVMTANGWEMINYDTPCSLTAAGNATQMSCADGDYLTTAFSTDISGLSIINFLAGAPTEYDDHIDALLAGVSTSATFSNGAKRIALNFLAQQASYQPDCAPGTTAGEDESDWTCWGTEGDFSDIINSSTAIADDPSDQYVYLTGEGNSGEVTDEYGEAGEVIGSWVIQIVNSESILLITIDDSSDSEQTFLTIINGQIVRGWYNPEQLYIYDRFVNETGDTDVLAATSGNYPIELTPPIEIPVPASAAE